jgi:iron complex outermembrane receptor protein
VDTYGLDLGLNYLLTKRLSLALNYSYFDFNLDKKDLKNDGNRNGVVTDTDLPLNTPTHKLSLALNYSSNKFFGSVFTRWVDAYDFFSGINTAAKQNTELGIKENARFGRTWNYGPLGGFVNVDISAGYRFGNGLQLSGQIVNLFNTEVREFVASPAIGRLYSIELKVNLPSVKNKK